MSADFQANPTDISRQKVVFLVIQNYALLFLSWTAFNSRLGSECYPAQPIRANLGEFAWAEFIKSEIFWYLLKSLHCSTINISSTTDVIYFFFELSCISFTSYKQPVRISNFCNEFLFTYFVSKYWQVKSFKLRPKYIKKCQYNSLHTKK